MVVMATTEEAGEFPVVFSGSPGAGAARGYSGAGVSHAPRSYGAGHYSSGISTARYGSYGHYAPRNLGGGQIYGSHAKSPSGIGSTQLARLPNYSGSYYIPRDQPGLALRIANPVCSPVIIRAPIPISAVNTRQWPQEILHPRGMMQGGMRTTGHSRM